MDFKCKLGLQNPYVGPKLGYVGAMWRLSRAKLSQVGAKLDQVGGKLGQVGGKRSRIWDMMVENGGQAGQDRPRWSMMEIKKAKIYQHVGPKQRKRYLESWQRGVAGRPVGLVLLVNNSQ